MYIEPKRMVLIALMMSCNTFCEMKDITELIKAIYRKITDKTVFA